MLQQRSKHPREMVITAQGVNLTIHPAGARRGSDSLVIDEQMIRPRPYIY